LVQERIAEADLGGGSGGFRVPVTPSSESEGV